MSNLDFKYTQVREANYAWNEEHEFVSVDRDTMAAFHRGEVAVFMLKVDWQAIVPPPRGARDIGQISISKGFSALDVRTS